MTEPIPEDVFIASELEVENELVVELKNPNVIALDVEYNEIRRTEISPDFVESNKIETLFDVIVATIGKTNFKKAIIFDIGDDGFVTSESAKRVACEDLSDIIILEMFADESEAKAQIRFMARYGVVYLQEDCVGIYHKSSLTTVKSVVKEYVGETNGHPLEVCIDATPLDIREGELQSTENIDVISISMDTSVVIPTPKPASKKSTHINSGLKYHSHNGMKHHLISQKHSPESRAKYGF